MAKITKLYENFKENNDMKEYSKKLWKHRAGVYGRTLAGLLAAIAIALSIRYYFANKTYNSYDVMFTSEHADTMNTQYQEYNGKILKYSRDGISCVSVKNEAEWSQIYNIENPILDVCKESGAVADKKGNTLYIFNGSGVQSEITTLLPIQQISVSQQGVAAVLLEDTSASWIYLYDCEGNQLIEAKCNLEESGQPISISISEDGTKLAVSYLQVDGGTANSCVVFYNFGSVGGNFVDKIVSSKVYTDTIIPKLEHLDSGTCIAVGDNGCFLYEGEEIPEETNKVETGEEIQSIFFGNGYFGLVYKGNAGTQDDEAAEGDARAQEDADHSYEMQVFDKNGNQVLTLPFDLEYTNIKISQKSIIVYNEFDCAIYNLKGVKKYNGTFDSAISDLYAVSNGNRYNIIYADKTEQIKLK